MSKNISILIWQYAHKRNCKWMQPYNFGLLCCLVGAHAKQTSSSSTWVRLMPIFLLYIQNILNALLWIKKQHDVSVLLIQVYHYSKLRNIILFLSIDVFTFCYLWNLKLFHEIHKGGTTLRRCTTLINLILRNNASACIYNLMFHTCFKHWV